MFLLALASLLTSPTMAQDCDSKALTLALEEATPIATAKAYLVLSACDEALAKKRSDAAFEKILSGSEGNQAALKAVQLEQDEVVRSWLAKLEPDERSRTLAFLGKTCKKEEAVQGFFVRAHQDLGEQFWEERWHRGLSGCRSEAIQEILTTAIADKGLKDDQSRFFTVLEVYSRNLGNQAVPTIAALVDRTNDPEELMYLVNALADAANVGGTDGVNPVAAKSATTALVQMGKKLPPRAVEQARKTLLAMGAEEEADLFATHRWPDRKTEEMYRYAVTLNESATCKNGKSFANLHFATFTEAGRLWPDQLGQQIGEKLIFEWELTAASRCKGEGSFEVKMPNAPFASEEDQRNWLTDQKKAFATQEAGADKAKAIEHDTFTY
jgi:hypothetical protein